MKKILLLLLFPFLFFSQTSLSDDDIYAAAGNSFEWLLTNVDTSNRGAVSYQGLLSRMGYSYDEKYKGEIYNDKLWQRRYSKNIISGNEKPSAIYLKQTYSRVKGYKYPIITKMEIWGDTQSIITFYINFWSHAINFRDTKPGETVTTRFLTDIAALSVGTNGQSKIVVMTVKDYYGIPDNKISESVIKDSPREERKITIIGYKDIPDEWYKNVLIKNLQSRIQDGWLRFEAKNIDNADYDIKVTSKGAVLQYSIDGNPQKINEFLSRYADQWQRVYNEDTKKYSFNYDDKIVLQDTLHLTIKNKKVSISY